MFSLSTSVENKSTTNGEIRGQRELINFVFIMLSENNLLSILQLSDNCVTGSSDMRRVGIHCYHGNVS